MPVVSLAQMMESGVHFGHQTRRWNPKMAPYIYTSRNGVHIIDLVQTAQLMEEAYTFMRTAAEQGKKFLFIGTKRQAAGIIAQEASRCGAYYVNQRWLGGMLTNWATIKTRVERLKDLERREESGALSLLPKKEAAVLRREMEKLEKIIRPSIGVLTNIGEAHDAGFQSQAQKLQEKLGLFKDAEVVVGERTWVSRVAADKELFSWGSSTEANLEIRSVVKAKEQTIIGAVYKRKEINIIIPFTDDASIQNAISCWRLSPSRYVQ